MKIFFLYVALTLWFFVVFALSACALNADKSYRQIYEANYCYYDYNSTDPATAAYWRQLCERSKK